MPKVQGLHPRPKARSEQWNEHKVSDPTVAEKFNTCRFADHKEPVIALLARVCKVSVETMQIVRAMP
jgi:predicted helicase